MRRAVRAIVVKDDQLLVMHRHKFGQEFYTLPGGAIDPGETAERAVIREVAEECSITVKNPRLIYVEDAGDPYGTQYIFRCEYVSGEVALDPASPEAQINQLGQNLYTPMWLEVERLKSVPMRSEALKQRLLRALSSGFPPDPEAFRSQAEIRYTEPS